MQLTRYYLKNFRRLEDVEVQLNDTETVFVGPNNSGKTSATVAFKLFVTQSKSFEIHDFPAALIPSIDDFPEKSKDDQDLELPKIELDLWFSIDPDIEYGRVATLLPSLSASYSEVGIRVSNSADNPEKLLQIYEETIKQDSKSLSTRTLSEYLSEERHLTAHFSKKYYMLEKLASGYIEEHSLDKDEGRSALALLLQVDFVDAQRNISDKEDGKSNRLSSAFSDFYAFNLEQVENDSEATAVIATNNDNLTKHYEGQFSDLLSIISKLGFPSDNDRKLKILSDLHPENALKGNTALRYIDDETDHHLPEAYNGLGFKNLVYIAIQICHFQKKWLATKEKRSLSQIIFIEEPEVHLHAQVQQTFISRVREIVKAIAKNSGYPSLQPQLLITTHSSHILDTVDFTHVRYFRRIPSKYLQSSPLKDRKVASEVLDLATFNETENKAGNLKFLSKYLRLTHCDLFFSDAAILIEGTVERLLLPEIINRSCPKLETSYITLLEVGGAYAHRFLKLLEFIGMPALIITDLDSVDPDKNRSKCIASYEKAITSNAALIEAFKKKKVSELHAVESRMIKDLTIPAYISFQNPIPVGQYGEGNEMSPRTFEEAFIYENLGAVLSGDIEAFVAVTNEMSFDEVNLAVYEAVKNKNYKKVEFALSQLESEHLWEPPSYIVEGLNWLETVVRKD